VSETRSTVTRAMVLLSLVFMTGCAGLIPPELVHRMHMKPLVPEGRGDYYVDLEDSSLVFSIEGALIKVRHLNDQELDQDFPPLWDGKHINPYTSGEVSPDIGYTPPIFTVFRVTVTNSTYSKIEFDPAQAIVLTDAGERLTFYDASRGSDSPNNFRKYYRVELGISGQEKSLALERMGTVYKTAYHRARPVFRGDTHSGLVAFDPLSQDVREITLTINDFVLSFDANNNPQQTVDCEFRFAVEQQIKPATLEEESPNGDP
jgi:hypothetical protein